MRVEKYRPDALEDLVSHKDIISTITKFMDQDRLPHLLFYGPPGTGKTSTILACAKRLFGDRWKSVVLELNASDDRGIDVVREQIINFASTKKIFASGFKMIILDEADSMTQPAQAALRRVMEKYTRNVRFCIICNYVSKIIPAIQSRCTRFRFAPLQRSQIEDRLSHIIQAENVNVTVDGRNALLHLAKGDMRKALNILQSTSAAYDIVDEKNVFACTGNPEPKDVEQVVNWLLEKDFALAYQYIDAMQKEKGLALADLITEVFNYCQNVKFPANMRVMLLDELSFIEYRLASGCSEKVQLGALIGIFQLSKECAAKV